jgi:mannosyltransferase OCH1-like enzyme
MQRCMETWTTRLPDFRIKRWDATNSPASPPYVQEASRRHLWSRLSNYVRLHALYTEGGVYLDTDVEVLKDLTPLLDDQCFLGFQQEDRSPDWVNAAVLGSERGHPLIRACMERTIQVYERTGRLDRLPRIMTAVLREMGLSRYGLQRVSEAVIYPVEYFYPHAWLDDGPARMSENTYCVHHWAGSWKKGILFETPMWARRLRRSAVTWLRQWIGRQDS